MHRRAQNDETRIRRGWTAAARNVALAGSLGLIATTAAQAQSASEITPPGFQPPPQRLTGALVFSGKPGLAAPEGADELSITIADVAVDGTLPGLEDETAAVRARLTRGTIPASEIFEAAADLEAAYVENGFILARVVLPAQSLRDGGTLRLVVVDGFVESVDTTAVPERVRGRLEQLTNALIDKRGLSRTELERRILLAGDTYGIALQSALATGTRPGGTVVILKPAYRRITGFIGFDNSQTDALGTWNIDRGIEFNGFLGMGEVFYMRSSGYPGDPFGEHGFFGAKPRQRTLAAGAVFPLNADGLSLNFEVTRSDTAEDDPDTPTVSAFQRVSTRLYYPWVRSRDFNLTTQVSLDLQTDTLDIDTGAGDLPVYKDKTTVLRGSINASWLRPEGTAYELGAKLSFGLDALGARSAADAEGGTPLSRDGADAEFTTLELSGAYRRPLAEDIWLSLTARGQVSFGDALVTAERFGIATFGELSAFDEGTLSGDSGWVVRGEVAKLIDVEMAQRPVTLRPFLFGASGTVHRMEPVGDEEANVRATAYGIGLEAIVVRDPAYSTASVRLELGRGDRDDGGDDGTRVSLVGSLRF